MSGTLTYLVPEGGDRFKLLRLTICAAEDEGNRDLASLRRKRLLRILREASGQGARLRYSDLCMIMLSSRSTIKRDISYFRRIGVELPAGISAA